MSNKISDGLNTSNDKKEIEDIPDILFTKETNNEQVEIIKNIYSHKNI